MSTSVVILDDEKFFEHIAAYFHDDFVFEYFFVRLSRMVFVNFWCSTMSTSPIFHTRLTKGGFGADYGLCVCRVVLGN